MKKVKDFMTKEVVTVSRPTPILEVMKIFSEHHYGGLPVVDEENRLLGIVTKKELLMMFIPDYFDLLGDLSYIEDFGLLKAEALPELNQLLVIDDVMIRKPVTATENMPLLAAASVMAHRHLNILPVVRDDKVVGIISQMDICRAVYRVEKKK